MDKLAEVHAVRRRLIVRLEVDTTLTPEKRASLKIECVLLKKMATRIRHDIRLEAERRATARLRTELGPFPAPNADILLDKCRKRT